jgi:AraC family transcriptional regulator
MKPMERPPPQLDLDLLHLRIVQSGRDWLGPWWYPRDVEGPNWVIFVHDRDGARVVVDGRTYPLRRGRVLVIPPHARWSGTPGREVRQVFFHVDAVGLSEQLARELLPAPLDLGDDLILASLAERLHALLPDGGMPKPKEKPASSLPLYGLAFVHQVFGRLIDCSPAARRIDWSERMAAHGPLAIALKYIDRQLDKPLYVGALAKLCGMGPQWFTRRFHAAIGRAPAQYILERRLTVAAQRLAFSDEPIAAIADACGFNDAAHLARSFRARRGVSPREYRGRALQERRG